MSVPSGCVALIGSGETGKHGRLVQERLLARYPLPVRVAIVETPAGFQPNIDSVTAKLRTFYEHNLQNFRPVVSVVQARRRGGPHDPDDPAVVATLEQADVIFAGPGSPTYAVKHLAGTATLEAMRKRMAGGATLVLSSAAAIAAGVLALPVYEVFKVGDDPHWTPGLNLLRNLGIEAAIVTHWNNREGGADLDTSHAYIGQERFADLLRQIPPGVPVLGIDEHTAVILEPDGAATVQGAGTATLISNGEEHVFIAGESFAVPSAMVH
jgi:cyanophycinase-like exopeptidase